MPQSIINSCLPMNVLSKNVSNARENPFIASELQEAEITA